MKTKKLTILTMIVWGFVLIVSLIIFISLLINRGLGRGFMNSWMVKFDNRGDFQVVNEGRYKDIKEIEVDWIEGNVNVFPHDEDEVIVIQKANKKISDKQLFTGKVSSGKLSIDDGRTNKGGISIFGGITNYYSTDIEIYLPKKQYRLITIETMSADVDTLDILADKVSISTVSGYIALDGAIDDINLDSVSGDIRINGRDLSENNMRVRVDTISGNMDMDFDTLPKNINTDAVSGDVRIILPSSNFTCELDSVSGDMKLDNISNSKGSKKYLQAGDGDCEIKSSSISGDVSITVE